MDYYDLKKNEYFLVETKALILKNNKLLVLKTHKGNDVWSNKWGLPGGLLEFDEEMEKGLLREIKEETAIDVKVKNILTVGDWRYDKFIFKDGRKVKSRLIVLSYICEYIRGIVKISNEHAGFKWVTNEELANLTMTPDSTSSIDAYLKQVKI